MGSRRRTVALCALGLAVVLVGACGGFGPDDVRTVTGRVVSVTDDGYCVSPDRSATDRCVDRAVVVEADGIDVGECATMTLESGSAPSRARIEVVDDAACAESDLGG